MISHDSLAGQVSAALRRAGELHRRSQQAGTEPLVEEALEELHTSLEELKVTGEELRVQNEALLLSRREVDDERQRYRELFDLAPDPYLVTDLHGSIREANRAAVRLLGLRAQDIVHKPLVSFVAEGGKRAFRTRLLEVPSAGRLDGWDLVLTPRSGPPRQVSAVVAVGAGRSQGPSVLRWALRDVTEQRRAEEAARRMLTAEAARGAAEAGHARVAGVLEGMSDAFWMVDADWQVVAANRRAEELWGTPREEMLGRAVWEAVPGAFPDEVANLLRAVVADGAPTGAEFLSPVLGRWLEVHAQPADGGLSLFFRDVDERRRAAIAQTLLAEMGTALAASLDPRELPQVVARAAAGALADWTVVYAHDEERLRALGVAHAERRREELLRGLVRRSPELPADHPVSAAIASGEPRLMPRVPPDVAERIAPAEEDRELLRALGLASAIVVPLRARGRTLGALVLARSDAARAYAPGDLALAEEVARRAAMALDNARLYQEAQTAVRARDDVLAVVSHDLRNPLNAVLVGASLLEELSPPERWSQKERRQLQAIRRSAESMTELIDGLVEVIARDAGVARLERHPEKVRALVSSVREMFDGVAGEKGVAMRWEVAPQLPSLPIDRARVMQVFSNLLGNALKFTPRGGSVVVSAAREGSAVRFSVVDTGPGIPAEHLPHLFDRYWQARRKPGSGIGLGLAIAQGIVNAHGGRMWVESEVGRGSTFHFTLPIDAPVG